MFWLTPMYGVEKKKRMVSSKKTSTLANLGHLLFLYTFSLSVYCITFTSSFVRTGESPVEYTLTKSTGIHENTDTFAYDRNLFEKAMAAIKGKNSSSKSRRLRRRLRQRSRMRSGSDLFSEGWK